MLKKMFLTVLVAGSVVLSGCSGAFWGGTGAGAVGSASGYELRARQQMEKIKNDRDAGRISQEEYNIRKNQIEQMSVTY